MLLNTISLLSCSCFKSLIFENSSSSIINHINSKYNINCYRNDIIKQSNVLDSNLLIWLNIPNHDVTFLQNLQQALYYRKMINKDANNYNINHLNSLYKFIMKLVEEYFTYCLPWKSFSINTLTDLAEKHAVFYDHHNHVRFLNPLYEFNKEVLMHLQCCNGLYDIPTNNHKVVFIPYISSIKHLINFNDTYIT